ncbi:MAG: hypothetical protein ACI8TX_001740 [Hyphomicrobiaceae bacterium]
MAVLAMDYAQLYAQFRAIPGLVAATATSVLLIVAACLPTVATNVLAWERVALADGELWRLVTAHFAQPVAGDAFASVFGIWIGWAVWRRIIDETAVIAVSITLAIATSAALWLDPRVIGPLAGSSAIGHGWLAYLIAADVLGGRRESLFLGVGLVIKLGLETIAPGVLDADRVLTDSQYVIGHRYAAIAGVAIAALIARFHSRKK